MTTELAIRPDQSAFTPAQVDTLKRQMGLDDVPDDELAVFFHLARRTGLDPFSRQIYLIPRWDSRRNRQRYTPQTSIDGLRLIADRTGEYAGSDAPQFEHDDQGRPYATVTVWRFVPKLGQRAPFVGVAFWDEFVQLNKKGEPQGLWEKMPRTMLAKCAEAQALRKGYPAEMTGLYTAEEMSQADSEATGQVRAQVRRAPQESPPVDVETGEIVEEVAGPIGQGEGSGGDQPNHDPIAEPPYAGEQERPNGNDLAIRTKQAGGNFHDIFRAAMTEAQQAGIRYTSRIRDLDKHPEMRAICQRLVEELEQSTGGVQETLDA